MSDAKKVNKLSDLSIDEVSLVDRGANQHAQVLIHKRQEDEEATPPEGEEVDKADPDPSSVSVEGADEDEDEATSKKDEEEVTEEESKEDGFFKRLISKMFREELTTDSDDTGTLRDMSDVDKAFPQKQPQQQMPGMQFGGQQPPPPAPANPMFQQGAPAPGPQGMMPPGAQGFPAGQAGQVPGQMQAGPPLPVEVVQYIQQLEQALAEAQGQTPSGDQEDDNVSGNQNPFGKSLSDMDEDEVTFLSELAKNLDDEDQREAITKALETVEKANQRAEAAETIAKAERDHRETQEYVAKARTYTHLPVAAEEFGPVLKRLNETLDEEQMGLVNKVLSAANETVASVGAFDEIGKRGSGEHFESISKVDAKAQEIVKNEEGVSIEQARERVLEENPSLYDEYVNESGR